MRNGYRHNGGRNCRINGAMSKRGAKMNKANTEGTEKETHAVMGDRGEGIGPVTRVLITYTGVDTPGTNEMAKTGVGGSVPGMVIHIRSGSGGNGEEEALSEILLNN